MEKEVELMDNGYNKKLLMKGSKRKLMAILIALPALAIFFVLLSLLIVYYDSLYETFLGPLYALFVFVVAAYALTLPFKVHLELGQTEIKTVIQKHLIQTFTFYIPIALLLCGAVVFWVYFARSSMQWAAQSHFVALEKLVYFMTLLMVLQEVMKFLSRRKGLNAYEKGPANAKNLKWNSSILQFLVIFQSVFFLFLNWSLFVLCIAVIRGLVKGFFSDFILFMAFVLAMILVIGVMIKLERSLEKYGRDQLFIPWKS